MPIEVLAFYHPLPRFGEKLSDQWNEFRDDFDALAPLVRAAYADIATTTGSHDLAGFAQGELDFRNRYRIFYDKAAEEWKIQYNTGTQEVPVWTDYVRIRNVDGRFIVEAPGGLESANGFYNVDYLTVGTAGITGGFSQSNVTSLKVHAGDGFYWSNDSAGGVILNQEIQTGAANPGFYGLVVKQSNDLQSYDGIKVLSFEADSFYLTQNASNTDEAQVNFRGTAAGGGGVTDHGALTGLADEADHTWATLVDGTRAFTGNQSMGSNRLTSVGEPTADTDAARLQDIGPGFYGIVAKQQDDLASFSGLEILAFETEFFYLTQNASTDEVQINLRNLPGAGGGEANTASNLAGDEGLFTTKSGVDLPFKSLTAGTNITLSSDANAVTINSTGGGGGFYGIVVEDGTTTVVTDSIFFTGADFDVSAGQGGAVVDIDTSIARVSQIGPAFYGVVFKQTDELVSFKADQLAFNRDDGFYLTADSAGKPVLNVVTSGAAGPEGPTGPEGPPGPGFYGLTVKEGSTVVARTDVLSFLGADFDVTADTPETNDVQVNIATDIARLTDIGPGFYGVIFEDTDSIKVFKTDHLKFNRADFYLTGDSDGRPIVNVAEDPGSGDGTALTVREEDGSPSVSDVSTIRVSNGSLTDNGGGDVSITTGGGGSVTFQESRTGGFSDASTVLVVNSNHFYLSGSAGGTDEPILSLQDTPANPEYVDSSDFTSASSVNGVTTWDSHAISDNPDRLVILAIHLGGEDEPPLTAVTYGGVPMAMIRDCRLNVSSPTNEADTNTEPYWAIYALANPPVGISEIRTDFEFGILPFMAVLNEFKNVNQFLPFGAMEHDTNTSANSNVDVEIRPSRVGSLIFSVALGDGGDTDPWTFNTTGGTERGEAQTGTNATTDVTAAWGTVPVTASNVDTALDIDWTMSASDQWTHFAVELLPTRSGHAPWSFENIFRQSKYQVRLPQRGTTARNPAEVQLLIPGGSGSTGRPGLSFGRTATTKADTDTGIAQQNVDEMQLVCGGQIMVHIDEATTNSYIGMGGSTANFIGLQVGAATAATSPETRLHVFDSEGSNYNDAIASGQLGTGCTVTIENSSTGAEDFAQITFEAGAGTVSRIATIRKAANQCDMAFVTDNSGMSEKMRIKADGKIGIGNFSSVDPSATFHVLGDGFFENSKVVAAGFYVDGGGEVASLDAPQDGDVLIYEAGEYREARFDPSVFYTSTGGDGRLVISIR